MSRENRSNINTSYVHLMVQGINKEYIFKNSEYKQIYVNLFNKLKKELNIKILVYTIMDNHAHMLIYCNNIETISKFMNRLNTSFARYYNTKENRVGYVFRNRYKTQTIKSREHLYNTISYIHNNPVKAGIAQKCEEYKFSSYNDFINKKISKEDIELLFENDDYIKIFKYIHKNYSEDDILEEKGSEDAKKVLKEFMQKNKLESIEQVKRNKKILSNLVTVIRQRCGISDKKIAELLGLGKNRIYILMNKKSK